MRKVRVDPRIAAVAGAVGAAIVIGIVAHLEAGTWTELVGSLATGVAVGVAVWTAVKANSASEANLRIARRAVKRETRAQRLTLASQRRSQASMVTWRCYPYRPTYQGSPDWIFDPRENADLGVIPFREDLGMLDGGQPYRSIYEGTAYEGVTFVIVEISNMSSSNIVGARIEFGRPPAVPFNPDQPIVALPDTDQDGLVWESREIAIVPVGEKSLVTFDIPASMSQSNSTDYETLAIYRNRYVKGFDFLDGNCTWWRRDRKGVLYKLDSSLVVGLQA